MPTINFYICQRFMTKNFPNYLQNNDFKFDEIVSVDCGLFPYDERRDYEKNNLLTENEQVLAVTMLQRGTELPTLDGFEFCGYDLADGDEYGGDTSALTNCGQFLNNAFAIENLNKYGLLNNRKTAEELQELLLKHYPDDPHSDCEIYAIWRKIKN